MINDMINNKALSYDEFPLPVKVENAIKRSEDESIREIKFSKTILKSSPSKKEKRWETFQKLQKLQIKESYIHENIIEYDLTSNYRKKEFTIIIFISIFYLDLKRKRSFWI